MTRAGVARSKTGTICQVVSSSRSHGDLVGMRSPGRRVSGRKVTRPLDMTPSQWASYCRSRCRKAMQRACALWYDRIWERTQEWKSGYRSIKPSKPLVAFAPKKTDGWGLPPPTRIEQYQRDIGPMAEGPLLEDVICLGPDGQGFDTPT